MVKDVEKDSMEVQYLTGYASLAEFISKDADHSAVLFRRFDRVGARNLLYLQSEIADLEERQEEFDKEDIKLGRDPGSWQLTKECARDWRMLKEEANGRAGSGNDHLRKRFELIKETRERMKEYREHALMDESLVRLIGSLNR